MNDVKCLHAHVADHLLRGNNKIGAWTLNVIQQQSLDTRGCDGKLIDDHSCSIHDNLFIYQQTAGSNATPPSRALITVGGELALDVFSILISCSYVESKVLVPEEQEQASRQQLSSKVLKETCELFEGESSFDSKRSPPTDMNE